MAELGTFQYIPGNSPVHSLDERVKIGLVLGFCGMTSSSSPISLLLLTLVLAGLFALAGFRPGRVLMELKLFLLFAVILFLARAFSFTGEPAMGFIPPPGDLKAGGIISWRFILLIGYGFLFAGTTRLFRINGALYWFLKKIPVLPAARISTMVSLTLNFIPLILSQYREIREAARARGSDSCPHPLKKGTALILPLFINIFRRADEMAEAMEARCYSGKVGDMDFKLTKKDALALGITGIIWGGVLLYSFRA